MATNVETIVVEAAVQIREALTRLGFAYPLPNGDVWEISYKSLELAGDAYGLLEVDVQRLPRRVHIDDLVHPRTLHHLTAVVGRPVKRLNTTGLTYCVVIKPRPRTNLPRVAPLDLSLRPEGMAIPIGRSRQGDLWRELAEAGHVLAGGATRSGKSTWLNAMLASLLVGRSPQEVRLALVDPKGIEFVAWRGAPHLLAPVASEPEEASTLLEEVLGEIRQRQTLFAQAGAKHLVGYNRSAAEPLPWLVVVVDEFTDIALLAGLKSNFYRDLTRLVSKGAALGVMAVLATQNPKAEVVNTLIRGNLLTRLAFRCVEAEQSRIILGEAGAEKLPAIPGRALARLAGELVEIQSYYLPDDEALALGQALSAEASSAPALTSEEGRLVRYAHEHLASAFTIGKLAGAFDCDPATDGGDRITRWAIQKAGERLEAQGLLDKPQSVTEPRRVSAELAALAGL